MHSSILVGNTLTFYSLIPAPQVVSMLDSGEKMARVQIVPAMLSGNTLRQTVHTHCASVHQVAKLVAALLRVVTVTVGLAESNGSLSPGL